MPSFFSSNAVLVAFWSPGPLEMMILAVLALLFYGGDLPNVARSWGKTLTDFRRGLSGIQNDINDVIYNEPEQLEYRPEENIGEEPAPSSVESDSEKTQTDDLSSKKSEAQDDSQPKEDIEDVSQSTDH